MMDFSIFLIMACYASMFLITIPLIWKIIHTMTEIRNQEKYNPGSATFYLIIYMFAALCCTILAICACAHVYGR